MQVTLDPREEAARWQFFHDLFRTPTLDQWDWLNGEPAQGAWVILVQEHGGEISEKLPFPGEFERFHEEYLQAFEVGAPTPACPLTESHWNKREPVQRILHENILFFKQFGLELRQSAMETADHLRHQLEFMAYFCSLQLRYGDEDEGKLRQVLQAKRDYLARHLLSWLPLASARISDIAGNAWPAQWLRLLNNFCNRLGDS